MVDEQSREVKELQSKAKSMGNITAKLTIDVSDVLTGLKALQRESRKATRSLRGLERQQNKDKLLVIELDQMGNVPKVFYKGKEIIDKTFVFFNWNTATDKPSNTDIIVDYYEKDKGTLINRGIHESDPS